jgi:UDP-N-acetyl-D-mannosaminuronate dehydrogenase
MSSVCTELLDRITFRRDRASAVGLGYGGLPLAAGFASTGFGCVALVTDLPSVDWRNRRVGRPAARPRRRSG